MLKSPCAPGSLLPITVGWIVRQMRIDKNEAFMIAESSPLKEDDLSVFEGLNYYLPAPELRFRVPLVVYKTHGEFQQTNITLAELPEGVGAFTFAPRAASQGATGTVTSRLCPSTSKTGCGTSRICR